MPDGVEELFNFKVKRSINLLILKSCYSVIDKYNTREGEKLEFDDKVPIYYQIKSYIYRQLVTGKLAPGDKLPSVRQLAMDLTVNVNTIRRALNELTAEKLIEPKRGKGNFATGNNQQISELKDKLINEQLKQFYEKLRDFNVTDEEILNYLKHYVETQRSEDE